MPSVRAVLTAALVVPVAYIVVGASQQHSGIDAGGDVCGGRGGNDLKQLGGNGVTPGMPADDPSKPSLEIQTGTLVDDAGKKRQHDTAQLETGGKEAASRGDRARESCKSSDDCPVMIDGDNDEVEQDGIAVDTVEQDGIQIEFVGTATGTIPGPASASAVTIHGDAGDPDLAGSAANGLELELLRCERGGGRGEGGEDGPLTLRGISNNMLDKLMRSGQGGQQTARKASEKSNNPEEERGYVTRNGRDGSGPSAEHGSNGNASETAALVERALALAAAPATWVFGSVPDWFSDAVFQVTTVEYSDKRDLPQRLLLVHDPPASVAFACNILARWISDAAAAPPSATPTAAATGTTKTPASPASYPASPSWLNRIARKACRLDSPVPGRVVSRPCYGNVIPKHNEDQRQRRGGDPNVASSSSSSSSSSWATFGVQKALGLLGFGGGGGGSSVTGADRGPSGFMGDLGAPSSSSCTCDSGGQGPCTIRAPPGRDPCLFIDVARSKRWGHPKKRGAESVTATSGVEVSTYLVPLPMTMLGAPSSSSLSSSSAKATRGARGAAESKATAATTAAAGEQSTAAGGWWRAWCAAAVDLLFAGLVGGTAGNGDDGVPPSFVVPVYVARLLMGILLLWFANPLSESRVFHYLLGALLGGGVAVAALLLRALGNPHRRFLRMLLVVGMGLWLALGAGANVIPSPASLLGGLSGSMVSFFHNGFARFQWAGKAFFAFSALVGVLLTRWQGLFLDEGESNKSWLNGQASIRRVLTVLGALLMYIGVSDSEIGVILVTVALSLPSIAHYVHRYQMWSNRSKWYRAGPMLSQSEYEAQGDEYTRQALEALRSSTNEVWRDAKRKVTKKSRKRLYEFVKKGADHYEPLEETNGSGHGCVIQ